MGNEEFFRKNAYFCVAIEQETALFFLSLFIDV